LTDRRHRIRAFDVVPSEDLIHRSARGGWGLVATPTWRSSHRPSSPRTQGPWGRWCSEMLGRTLRRNTAPGDWSWRPFARHTQPQHREYPPGGEMMDLSSLTSAPSTFAPSTCERTVVRPKGPAVLPARVGGPGGCHPHPVRPNGPTVPRTARAARGMLGPLGRHLSWSVLPGPLGRAGRTAGPLGRKTPAAPPPAAQPTPAGSQRVAGGRAALQPPATFLSHFGAARFRPGWVREGRCRWTSSGRCQIPIVHRFPTSVDWDRAGGPIEEGLPSCRISSNERFLDRSPNQRRRDRQTWRFVATSVV